jgi:hypothetical protein|tara:strand:+ start:192 stop:488 length:297 start_codon:yes stop_codon:yes gene_type:complete
MNVNKTRSISLIFLVLFFGAMMGTLLGELLGFLLPPGVVKDFFLTSVYFDLAGLFGNATGVVTIDLVMFVLKFGLEITINFTSIIGLATAYYFLRFYR